MGVLNSLVSYEKLLRICIYMEDIELAMCQVSRSTCFSFKHLDILHFLVQFLHNF